MERYLKDQEPHVKPEPFDFVDSASYTAAAATYAADIIQDSWIKAEIKEEDLFQVGTLSELIFLADFESMVLTAAKISSWRLIFQTMVILSNILKTWWC